MLHFKNSRRPGYSMIYGLILGGLCVILVLTIYKIEIQRKKYMLDFQKSILKSENVDFRVDYYNGR
ncbi:hypothetical protein [Clostridium guangxiense]|uniref:hypothetical protein n=1 Tax=Clostridium guangxiense TaxID=1662055 RepID=UPI001E30A547|nr:hypothetical protein [Clostridium guangxiense]MCD2345176.1 hypothetical protein [Clostridium guangxiense]